MKDWVAALLRASGWMASLESQQSDLGWLLMLHRTLPLEELGECYNRHLSISPESLDNLLSFLKRSKKIVGFDEFIEAKQAGKSAGLVSITFDDGWEDNYRCAAPVLRSHTAPAMIYLASALIGSDSTLPEERFYWLWNDAESQNRLPELLRIFGWTSLGYQQARTKLKSADINKKLHLLREAENAFLCQRRRRRFMNWSEVRELSVAGITFGAHTSDHSILTAENEDTAASQLRESKTKIEKELGVSVVHFAYPSGGHNSQVVTWVRSCGFRTAATTIPRAVTPATDPMRLPRIAIDDLVLNDAAGRFSSARAKLHFIRAGRRTSC